MKPQFYAFPVDFDTTIAAGGNASKTVKLDSAGDFVCRSFNGTIFTPALVLTTTIIGTPFPFESSNSPSNTGNIFPTTAHFRLQITIAGVDWFANPIRCSMLFANNGGAPHYFVDNPRIAAGMDIKVTLYNDVTVTFGAQAQVMFEGLRYIP